MERPILRQIIISVLGILIIAAGFLAKQKMAANKKPEPEKEVRAVPSVFTQKVKNGSSSINITASGNLAARDRIEIFSEVQGIFDYSSNLFKPGVYYKKGAILMRLNSDEFRANLRAQKSNLYNQIVSLLPDLRFDYPDAFQKWQDYVNDFDVEQVLKPLPKFESDKEKLFIAGRNINSTWFNVKNIEERLTKYTIYAPFSGVLTEANIDKGALVREDKKLGEFINPNIYELEVSVNSSYADLLKTGNSVTLNNIERTKSWTGKVNRLNSLIDPNTQTILAFIRVSGKGLREGMYLEADLTAKNEENTFEVSRKLITDNNKLFVLDGDKLILKEIEPVHFTEKTVIVRGLADGTEILDRMLPGAYEGMTVKRFQK
ncbi:MAG: efflux RND transporter periplasmic adaptor subunit [Saprospiraceae bacterium]